MKTEYEIILSNSSLYKNESLLQVIESLEKLDSINTDITGNINNEIIKRKAKLENLHSRIIRINKILNKLRSVNKEIALLSKKFYPENVESYVYQSIYYNDIYDFSLSQQINKFKVPNYQLNSKPLNSLEELGKQPNTDMDDMKLTQEIVNLLAPVETIKDSLNMVNSLNPIESQPISKEITMLSSVFSFISKIKSFGRTVDENLQRMNRDSGILNDALRANQKEQKVKQKKNIDKPSAAPTTMTTTSTKAKIEQNKDVIRRKTKINNDAIDAKIMNNINFQALGIVDIDINTANNFGDEFGIDEDLNIEELIQSIPGDQFASDDINTFEMPIDKVFQLKKKKTTETLMDTNNQNHQVNQNTNSNSKQNQPIQNNSNSIPINNQNINNVNPQNLNNDVVKKDVPNNNNLSNLNTTNIPNSQIPIKVENSNSDNISIVNTQNVSNVPKVPNIPTNLPNVPNIVVPNIQGINQSKIVVNSNVKVPVAPKIALPVPKVKPLNTKKVEEEEKKTIEKVKTPKKEPEPPNAVRILYRWIY